MVKQRRPLSRAATLVFAGLALLLTLRPPASAEDTARSSQFHFRTGMLSGSLSSNGLSGALTVSTPMDMEYETFSTSRRSLVFRAILGDNSAKGRMEYIYGGVGKRYYFKSSGADYSAAEGANAVVARRTTRFYVGLDAGISEVVVQDFGPVLTANSVMFDFGGCIGGIFQLSQRLGLELHGGYTYGYGFSSISVSATTMRMLLGLSYLF